MSSAASATNADPTPGASGTIVTSNADAGSDASDIRQLKAQLAEKDALIAELKQKKRRRDARIEQLKQANAAKADELEGLKQAIAEKDTEIAALNDAVDGKDTEIAALNDALDGKDAEITELKGAAVATDAEIAQLKRAVVGKDAKIAAQMEALALTVDALRRELSVPDNWIQVRQHPDPAKAAAMPDRWFFRNRHQRAPLFQGHGRRAVGRITFGPARPCRRRVPHALLLSAAAQGDDARARTRWLGRWQRTPATTAARRTSTPQPARPCRCWTSLTSPDGGGFPWRIAGLNSSGHWRASAASCKACRRGSRPASTSRSRSCISPRAPSTGCSPGISRRR